MKQLFNLPKAITSIFLLVFILGCYGQKKTKEGTQDGQPESIALTGTRKIPLFNGTDFQGWYFTTRDTTFSGTVTDIFEIENGVIHALGKPEDGSEQTFAGLTTEKEYSKYSLSLEYKWGEKKFKPRHDFVRDAGVLFHVHGEDVIWPKSVECQIQEGDTGDIWAIGTQVTSKVNPVILNYDPNGDPVTRGGAGIPFSRFHRGYDWEKPHGEWNRLTIEVDGDHAKYTLNGQVVNEAIAMKYWDGETKQMEPLKKGKILLQAEGAEIYYRNVFLEEYE